MLLCQLSTSLENTVRPIWLSRLSFQLDHEDTPTPFYSWVANIMTEKPLINEQHAKAIEVME